MATELVYRHCPTLHFHTVTLSHFALPHCHTLRCHITTMKDFALAHCHTVPLHCHTVTLCTAHCPTATLSNCHILKCNTVTMPNYPYFHSIFSSKFLGPIVTLTVEHRRADLFLRPKCRNLPEPRLRRPEPPVPLDFTGWPIGLMNSWIVSTVH